MTKTPAAPHPAPPSPGLGDIPTLPVFLKLQGQPAILGGGSLPAVWKAELLAAAGAIVTVFDARPCAEMQVLAERLGLTLKMVKRDWMPDDLPGAAVAIGALEGAEAEAFRTAAKQAGVPVNIIDVPDLCDFQFGTIVARSPLLIAISTDGAAPVFGQALRARIEGLLPVEIAAWARAAKDWRPDVQARRLSFAARRKFWEVFADRALAGTKSLPTEEDRQACLEAALETALERPGSLDLVGLGPGDDDLVTLSAIRALQSADVIIHAPDVSLGLIGLGRREARIVAEEADDQDTIRRIGTMMAEGRRVAWAAHGDPAFCCRWLQRRAGLDIEPREIVRGLRCDTCPRSCDRLA